MTAKRKGAGRPRVEKAKQRTEVVYLRMRKDEKAKLAAIADRDGETMAGWCRRVIVEAMRRAGG